jgi:hypothetical protein
MIASDEKGGCSLPCEGDNLRLLLHVLEELQSPVQVHTTNRLDHFPGVLVVNPNVGPTGLAGCTQIVFRLRSHTREYRADNQWRRIRNSM